MQNKISPYIMHVRIVKCKNCLIDALPRIATISCGLDKKLLRESAMGANSHGNRRVNARKREHGQ